VPPVALWLILPARAVAVIERMDVFRSSGGVTPASTDRWMPTSRGCVDMGAMNDQRVDSTRAGRRDASSGATACPPIGPGGRRTGLAHALFYATLGGAVAMALVRSSPSAAQAALEVGLVVLLVAWYSYWVVRRGLEVGSSIRVGALHFGGSALLWTALLALDPAYELLSFTAFAQVLGYLRWRAAILGAALACILVHVPQSVRAGGVDLGHVVFSLVGLAVLTLFILSVRLITEQSHRRQRLIDELEATREELARTARHAGMLEERQRLAGEIHDTLAQAFTSIVMLLEAVQAGLDSGSKKVAGHIEQALHTAREALGEARRLVWSLRPESLERGSLPEALRRVTSQLAEQTGIAAHMVVTGEARPLPAALEITLLRTAQEALANVRRHAHARQVTLTLSYMDDVTVLDVCDDGVGFDPGILPTGPGRQGGLGLVAMRERVEALGGSLTVESSPGQGSTLVVELPATLRLADATDGSEARSR
jgi:signal transduction histidine kinase